MTIFIILIIIIITIQQHSELLNLFLPYPPTPLQDQESNTVNIKTTKEPLYKRILIVDDDTDITFTFKLGLERYYEGYEDDNDKQQNKI